MFHHQNKRIYIKGTMACSFLLSVLSMVGLSLTANAQHVILQNTSQALRPVIEPWGYPIDAFDNNTRPQDDFYRHANGGWIDANEIPSDRSGIGFSVVMRERNETRMNEIIASLQTEQQKRGSDGQKIRDLYLAYLDEARIQKLGLKPFEKDLARIGAASSHGEIAALMADPVMGIGGPFGVFVNIDAKNPDAYAIWASHSGLSMPDRSYYLRDSERLEATRKAYRTYLRQAIGVTDRNAREVYASILNRKSATHNEAINGEAAIFAIVEERANAVFDLEKSIAQLHWTRAERRNASRTYNPMSFDELEEFAPGFPWINFAAGLDVTGDARIILREKEAFPALAKLFADTPGAVWRDYLLVQYLGANAQFMPEAYDDLRFSFFGTALSGQKEQRDRSKRALTVVDQRLGQAIGKIYIERFFPEEAKRQVTEMFENIRTAFATRIENLSWMTPQTKQQALVKLKSINAKIAYPEIWRDYSGVKIDRRKLFKSIKSLRQDNFNRDVERLGKPVDRREWFSPPQTVNAFYSPTRNESFIPAGYIQSPLFDPYADPALNYGALGSIIGHEIGHGFDDQGSKYDARGILQSWWTQEDRAAFDALGDRLAAQFDSYEPLPGLNVNGRQTLGENIGDLAGMTVAYHAYILSLKGEEPPVLDGLTGQQRFFLGRAQGRRYKRTEQSLRQRLLSAPHSPMYLRVNGMIRNMDEWYDAYDVKQGDDLYLSSEDRVRIW